MCGCEMKLETTKRWMLYVSATIVPNVEASRVTAVRRMAERWRLELGAKTPERCWKWR